MEQTEQSLQLEAANKRNNYLSSVNKLSNAKENLSLNEKVKTRTQKKFKEGMAASFELTQIENQYLSSQSAYIGALLDAITAKADLDYATANY
jgi:outer membrane protein TolC